MTTNYTVETNTYYAKCMFPLHNDWQSPWNTSEGAETAARRFVADWASNGVTAQVGIFFRNGQLDRIVK